MSKTNVYVLKLEGGRYYVGKSNDLYKRYEQHLSGTASSWTNKYEPVTIEKIIENVSPFEEDKVTKEYMSKYGIDKVRGGSYAQVVLDKGQIEALTRELRGAKDQCRRCGRAGHFIKDCYAKSDASGCLLEGDEEEEEEDEEVDSEEEDDSEDEEDYDEDD